MAINKNFLFELSVFVAIVALAGHLTTHFWDRYFFHHEISNMKTNIHMLKYTVRNIGEAYDDLHKELNELAKLEQRRSSAQQYDRHYDSPQRHERNDRHERNERNNRHERNERNERNDRHERNERNDRHQRNDHHYHHDHYGLSDNHDRFDRHDRYDYHGLRDHHVRLEQKQHQTDQKTQYSHDQPKNPQRHLDRRKQHEINVLATLKEKGTLKIDTEPKTEKPKTNSTQTQNLKNATTVTKSCLKSTGVGINTKKYCVYKQDCRCNKTRLNKHWKY